MAPPAGSISAMIERLLRDLAPQVLAAVVRRYGGFDSCEDAVQEALLAAAEQWPTEGIPDNPKAWLITVAARRRIELLRSDTARRRREETVAAQEIPDAEVADRDDTLTLLFLCCHPALTATSQVALTLRAVGGLTTAEIARALLLPETTLGQRISRAKQRIKAAGARFDLPPADEQPGRLAAVMHVLYLIFTEGHTASSGAALHRIDLSAEAIRLTRELRRALPDHGEVVGLLALMLLTEARRPARIDESGDLVPLTEQDRRRWDTALIADGIGMLTAVLATEPIGPYQVQAAIAAVHAEAARPEDTDWPQIRALYDLLAGMAPGPMVTLNRAVAIAMVNGPAAGLAELDGAAEHYRLHAVRAHLLEMAGDAAAAKGEYEIAARGTLSVPEQRYLRSRAAVL